jgi:hypothetical protein
MHLLAQTLAAVASSPWIIPGPMQETPGLGLALTFSSNANMTVSVQHTLDDPEQNPRTVTLARAGTVLTITDTAHNLIVGDNIVLSNPTNDPNNIWSGGGPPAVGTSYDVATIVDQNNYTVTVANSGSAAGAGAVRSFRVFNHSILAGVTGAPPARSDGNYAFQIAATRLKCTVWTAGTVTLTVQQGKGY